MFGKVTLTGLPPTEGVVELSTMPGTYDTMQVCLSGHRITDSYYDYPQFRANACSNCGEKTVISCESCGEEIRGSYRSSGFAYLGEPRPVPSNCHNCGEPYPWSEQVLNSQPQTTQEVSLKVGLFISHSAQDLTLATAFISLMEGCFEVPAKNAILCTSVPGYKITTSTDSTSDVLRASLQDCRAIVGLVTSASVKSMWVGAELGAAWALKKELSLLVIPPCEYNSIEGPLSSSHLLKTDVSGDLEQLLEELKERVQWTSRPLPRQRDAVSTFLNLCSSPALTPNP